MESIQATMVSVRFRTPERNWLIATMHAEGKNFTATGDIPYSETEELVQLYGEWTEDSKYGKQFKVSTSHRVLPTSVAGLRNYLAASEDIKGVGPARADKLAKFFGDKLLSILDEKSSDKLATCPGISIELAGRIISGWGKDSSIRSLSLYLAKRGVSPRWAARILNQWDAGTAVQKITANPYSLTAIEGIGFTTADEIARAMGWTNDSPVRAEAACLHSLSEGVQNGNVYMHEGEIVETVVKLIAPKKNNTAAINKATATAKEALQRVIERKDIVVEEVSDGVMNLRLMYLPWLYKAEKGLAERITEISNVAHHIPAGLDQVIKQVEAESHVDFSPKQLDAIRGVFLNHFVVITGGPGTGKTTCTKAICSVAESLQRMPILCAPTGRAAKRLSEITGRPATTIHRLLKWRDGAPVHGASNPIEADVLIIDECSMLDLELAGKLLVAVPRGCSVVCIGDIDQLPAIGAGTTLRDILSSGVVQSVTLDTIFRQAESSLIVRNAHLIRKGEMPRFPEAKGAKEDSYVLWIPPAPKGTPGGRDDAEWLKSSLGTILSKHIPDKFAREGKSINPIRDIQVLVPMKKHTMGTGELNKVIQAALNPNGMEFIAGGKVFRYGDRVMQMRNNYSEGMEIYNGDIGFIASNSIEDKTVQIDFYDRRVDYPYGDLSDLTLAYAQTIHKSQGSEYPVVVVVMGYQHWPMLERNLLYTANTRARQLCLYMAAKGAIQRAVENNPVKSRNTYLAQRLRIAMDKSGSEEHSQ